MTSGIQPPLETFPESDRLLSRCYYRIRKVESSEPMSGCDVVDTLGPRCTDVRGIRRLTKHPMRREYEADWLLVLM